MAKNSEAKIRANQRYTTKAYYRPCVCLRREYEELLREKAEENGTTISGYIVDLIKKDLGIKEGNEEG